ncbi:2-succinyl-5-enolpyruvyl-6-hydroxy-3-cyclohexene-1-carboxylate synthase, partial [bacterium]|nr:2-succinyl-5-enolpyruvyl-6-hydroxy-3-cyclohexene-1-carboxylate synthase [bacterium]
GLRFGAVVASFGLDHHQPGSAAEFAAALAAALETGRSAVIEVRTDRARNASEHRRLQQAIDDALAGAFH